MDEMPGSSLEAGREIRLGRIGTTPRAARFQRRGQGPGNGWNDMSRNQNPSQTSRASSLEHRSSQARSFAHHYGDAKRAASSDRLLRVYPPLAWGVLRHVRRSLRRSEDRIDELHVTRAPLAL